MRTHFRKTSECLRVPSPINVLEGFLENKQTQVSFKGFKGDEAVSALAILNKCKLDLEIQSTGCTLFHTFGVRWSEQGGRKGKSLKPKHSTKLRRSTKQLKTVNVVNNNLLRLKLLCGQN